VDRVSTIQYAGVSILFLDFTKHSIEEVDEKSLYNVAIKTTGRKNKTPSN